MNKKESHQTVPLPRSLTERQASVLNEAADNLFCAIQTAKEIMRINPDVQFSAARDLPRSENTNLTIRSQALLREKFEA